MRDVGRDLQAVYEAMEGSDASRQYSERHGIEAQAVLTVHDDDVADLICERFHQRLAEKTVVEIGGGIGLLALHIGLIAKRVYCIEANPMWSWVFAGTLLRHKPRNVSFLFGAADEFVGAIKGDVAIYCTHSQFSRTIGAFTRPGKKSKGYRMIVGRTLKTRAPITTPHDWFAWHPVRLEDGRWAWFETVLREWRWHENATWVADYSGYAYMAKA